MKKTIFQFALVFILANCTYNSITPFPLQATLKIGDGKFAITPTVSISLDSILNDSRCPINANCIWAGNAEARFVFFESGNSIKFNLTIAGDSGTETEIQGYHIKLLQLNPYPSASVITKQEDYQAEVLIRK